MAREHFVIGTAGHIDHGKTSLVRALTGVDLDRLPEERERGITIALGFTALSLPSGRVASFVDVPGHERLVRTMIAGASGLQAVLLCVSAVEGVMPQTREHLDILGILGVSRGLVALTMTDLVDEEMLELAWLDVEEAVEGTFLEGAPILHTAAGPEPAGIEELKAAIDALETDELRRDGPFRLPVDRAFVQRGFGTVVTGTARSGQVSDGAAVEILPEGVEARVRGVQVHGQSVQEARAGQRTALNLAGVERDDLARGMVVVEKGTITPASILDARLSYLPQAAELPSLSRVRLLHDTAEVMAVLTVLDDEALRPGRSHLVQLRTDSPIVALPGDRFVIRRESPVQTLGGGVLLDPWARRVRRKHADRAVRELQALEEGDRGVFLARAGDEGLPEAVARQRGVLEVGVLLADRVLHPERVARFEAVVQEGLARFHAEHPLLAGAPKRQLHRADLPQLSAAAFDQVIGRLVEAGRAELDANTLRLAAFTPEPDAEQRAALDAIAAEIRTAGFEGPRTADALRERTDEVTWLIEAGVLVRVGDRLLHRDHTDDIRSRVRGFLAEHPEMSAPDFKALTGLSRKHAIPLLEWLDASGTTRRVGDARVLA